MIDGKTKFATVIEYNYGKISSKTDQDIKVTNLTAAESQAYNLVYHNLFAESHYNVDWADASALKNLLNFGTLTGESIKEQAMQVKYGIEFNTFAAYKLNPDGTINKNTPVTMSLLGGISAISSINSAFDKYLSKNGYSEKYISIKDAEFITKSTDEKSEYFEAVYDKSNNYLSLKPIKTASQITAPVPSILRLKVIDSFGFEREINLDMTIVQNLND